MPVYTYIAIDTANRKHKGTLEAENENRIKAILRKRQLILLHLAKRETTTPTQWWQHFYRLRQWSAFITVTFIRQLATLLAAGLPVTEALTTLAAQTHHPRIKAFMITLHRKVSEGHSLA